MRNIHVALPLVVTLIAAVSAACAPADEDVESLDNAVHASVTPRSLNQWSSEHRSSYYRTSEGSQLLPYKWFLALEEATSQQPFRNDRNMWELGFLPEEASSNNPDGLPVGVAKDEDATGEWVGLNCAACHTSQIVYRGQHLRIDGGSGLLDMNQFLDKLLAALRATNEDDAKFQRFVETIVGSRERVPADVLREFNAWLNEEIEMLEARIQRNRPDRSPGRGLVDPVANIFNETICGPTNMPQNCATPGAPLKLPHLWGITQVDWVQANSLAHNPLPRNVSQSMGVFARTTMDEDCEPVAALAGAFADPVACNFRSTVRVKNMVRLEQDLDALKSPRWPSDLLGPIEDSLAQRGKALYETECAACHALPPYPRTAANEYSRTFIPVTNVPLEQIGTDPLMARTTVGRRADPGRFRSLFAPEDFDADGKVPALKMVSLAVGGVLTNQLIEELRPAELTRLEDSFDNRSLKVKPTPEQLLSYKSRPLAGIAFAGYLLHNGSVPSLYELLLPAAERSKVFHVGNREFDPVRVGFVSDAPSPGSTKVDTTLPGFSNSGHEYGTRLPDGDRWALVEFMKTL